MTIKAIETLYRGYRFRSRLEARWAVFFDQLEVPWIYECEGLEVEGVRYLPESKAYVEIKPESSSEFHTPRVYIAGRMKEPCFRPFDVSCEYETFHHHFAGYAPLKALDGVPIRYTGPFRAGWEDHCSLHGINDCFSSETEAEVFARSVRGIESCDLFFAMIEDLEAYGTLVEIGVAHGLDKPIYIGLTAEFVATHGDDIYENAKDRWNPLWFSAHTGQVKIGTRGEIFAWWGDIASEDATREQKLARGMVRNGLKACIVYGDPYGVFVEHSGEIYTANAIDALSSPTRRTADLRVAAEAARQARFEHGECGAPA
jgi:hypothetical protein